MPKRLRGSAAEADHIRRVLARVGLPAPMPRSSGNKHQRFNFPDKYPRATKLLKRVDRGLKRRSKRSRHVRSRMSAGSTFPSWSGKSINSFATITSGSAKSATDVMVVKSSLSAVANTIRNYPHDCSIKIWVCTNSLTTEYPKDAIGYIDRIYSNSSVDAKHLSWMMMSLSTTQDMWKQHAIGNSLTETVLQGCKKLSSTGIESETNIGGVAYKTMITIDRIPEPGDMLHTSNGHRHDIAAHLHTFETEGINNHSVLQYHTHAVNATEHLHGVAPVAGLPGGVLATATPHAHAIAEADGWTVDGEPAPAGAGVSSLANAETAHSHYSSQKGITTGPASGPIVLSGTTLNAAGTAGQITGMVEQTLDSTINNIAPLKTKLASAASIAYNVPNHVVSGIDIDLSFNSASVSDQWFTIKLCRDNNQKALQQKLKFDRKQELLNKQDVTDSKYFETVWQHSFFMPRMTSFQSRPNKIYKVSKKIRCNYARSVVRKESAASESDSYGGMLSPAFSEDSALNFYNGLFLVMTSKVVDEAYAARMFNLQSSSTTSNIATTTLTHQREAVKLSQLVAQPAKNATGFAQFGVSGSVTQRFRVKDYYRRKDAIPDIDIGVPTVVDVTDQ